MTPSRHQGFVALISAIIISAVLLLIAAVLSFSGFYGRYNILDSDLKERSLSIAEACADTAYLQIVSDPNNAAGVFNATTTVGGDYCYISARDTSVVGKVTYKTRSYYKDFYSNLKVTIATSTFSVVSWEEIATF